VSVAGCFLYCYYGPLACCRRATTVEAQADPEDPVTLDLATTGAAQTIVALKPAEQTTAAEAAGDAQVLAPAAEPKEDVARDVHGDEIAVEPRDVEDP